MLDAADDIRFDINYVNEVLPGETVELWSVPLPALPDLPEITRPDYPVSPYKAFAFEGKREGAQGTNTVFRAELHLGMN
jgi:hypothetical protein